MARRARGGLYFILNPTMGIIKIGITDDLDSRKKNLECGCGVPLDVMRFVANAQHHEKALHFAFASTRLCGEWFSPSEELVALADGAESIEAFLARKAPDIALAEAARGDAQAVERAAREEVTRLRREERARIAAAKALADKQRAERRETARLRKEEEVRAAHRAAQDAWLAKTPDVITNRVLSTTRSSEAASRRELVAQQRARNAAMIGVAPTEALVNA